MAGGSHYTRHRSGSVALVAYDWSGFSRSRPEYFSAGAFSLQARFLVARRVLTISPRDMWSAQAQGQAEGLTLLVAENTTGYFGVYLNNTGQPKPYRCGARLGGTDPLKL